MQSCSNGCGRSSLKFQERNSHLHVGNVFCWTEMFTDYINVWWRYQPTIHIQWRHLANVNKPRCTHSFATLFLYFRKNNQFKIFPTCKRQFLSYFFRESSFTIVSATTDRQTGDQHNLASHSNQHESRFKLTHYIAQIRRVQSYRQQ